MGGLRFLLAIAVAAEHSNFSFGPGSYTAIQAFFIISGFYMSHILSGHKYTILNFYKSRFFRLFPSYWIVLIIALAYFKIGSEFEINSTIFTYVSSAALTFWQILYLTFTNVFVLFSDLLWFFPNAFSSTHSIHFLVIPPIWSVGLELFFYLLCPWLITLKSCSLWLIVLGLFGFRILAYIVGANADPRHARFIGFEMAWFIMGIISQRACANGGWRWLPNHRLVHISLIGTLFAVALSFASLSNISMLPNVYGMANYIPSLVFYVLLVITLPYLFDLSRNSQLDAYIGEYSYPLYIWHYVFVVLFIHSGLVQLGPIGSAAVVVAVSIIHSVFLVHFIQRPIDAFRRNRYANPIIKKDRESGLALVSAGA